MNDRRPHIILSSKRTCFKAREHRTGIQRVVNTLGSMNPLWVQGSTQIPTFVFSLLRKFCSICVSRFNAGIVRLSFADFQLWGMFAAYILNGIGK